MQVALGLAHDPRLGGDVERNVASVPDHQLGRAAADVEYERRRQVGGIALARRSQERQARLLVARQHVGLQPVPAAHRGGELVAVDGVADRAGQHRDRPLAAMGIDLRAVAVQRREHARHRVLAQPAAGVDAGAEAGHVAGSRELGVDAAVPEGRSAGGSSWTRCPRPRRSHGHRMRQRLARQAGGQVHHGDLGHERASRGSPTRCAGRARGWARSAAGRRRPAALDRSRPVRRRRSFRRAAPRSAPPGRRSGRGRC